MGQPSDHGGFHEGTTGPRTMAAPVHHEPREAGHPVSSAAQTISDEALLGSCRFLVYDETWNVVGLVEDVHRRAGRYQLVIFVVLSRWTGHRRSVVDADDILDFAPDRRQLTVASADLYAGRVTARSDLDGSRSG
ncbi:MAG: hypothetical protein WCA46_16240 [Actinocatenispora sp.]